MAKKHRKLFYVPGMISLVVLPLLCLYYFSSNKSFRKYCSVSVKISSYITNVEPDRNCRYQGLGYVPKRNYITYNFNGKNDEQKLTEANQKMLQFMKGKDTINGVKFNFTQKSTYNTFIRLIDQLALSNVPNYEIFQNSFYMYVIPEEKNNLAIKVPIRMITCGNYDGNRAYFDQLEADEKFRVFINNLKRYKLILVAFVGLLLVNIYAFIKRNTKENYI